MKFYRENRSTRPRRACRCLRSSRSSSRSTTRSGTSRSTSAARATCRACTSSRHRGARDVHWGGFVLLAIYVAQPDGVDALHVGDGATRRSGCSSCSCRSSSSRDRALSRRPRPLLGDDEPLDGRPGADHPPAVPKTPPPAPVAEEDVADAAEGRGRPDGGAAREAPQPPKPHRRASRSRVKRKKKAAAR